MDRMELVVRVLVEAKQLRSEGGENPEYDRALVELANRILGHSQDAPQWADTELLILGTVG